MMNLETYRIRTKQALVETQGNLEKEMGYQPHLRNQEMIAFYTGHIAKLEAMLRSPDEEMQVRIMRMTGAEIANRDLRGQRCDECNDLIVWHSRGGLNEPFKTCVNRKCSEYMLTATTLASEFEIQDDGSGNQVLADGTVLR